MQDRLINTGVAAAMLDNFADPHTMSLKDFQDQDCVCVKTQEFDDCRGHFGHNKMQRQKTNCEMHDDMSRENPDNQKPKI